jgi:beta-galactosidase/beta-glucuronidase
MKTITIQIGNSDDKLTQVRWSEYVQAVEAIIFKYSSEIHFSGASLPFEPWQNAAWVAEVYEDLVVRFKFDLSQCREKYAQESVAFTIGDTEFV